MYRQLTFEAMSFCSLICVRTSNFTRNNVTVGVLLSGPRYSVTIYFELVFDSLIPCMYVSRYLTNVKHSTESLKKRFWTHTILRNLAIKHTNGTIRLYKWYHIFQLATRIVVGSQLLKLTFCVIILGFTSYLSDLSLCNMFGIFYYKYYLFAY